MKLLCCGDFHIGAGADYGARPGDRLQDQDLVLEHIVNLAREYDVDAVLFAGDAFERRSPTPAELMVWRRFRDALAEPDAPPLITIAGNHDVAGPELPTAMEVVGSTGRMPEVVPLDVAGTVWLASLPWVPVSRLVALEGGGDRDTLHESAARYLEQTARGMREQIPADATAILLAHWSVAGASLPNGLPTDQLREPVLEPGPLAELYHYVVLGHIHKPQVFDEYAGTFYVGSPMPLNFGEAVGAHGFYFIDTEASFVSQYQLESRPFVTIGVDLIGDELALSGLDETDYLAAAIAERFPLAGAVVRLRYQATEEQARRVDQGALRSLIADAGAHKLYAIQPDIVRSDRVRVKGIDETMDERQALTMWYAQQVSAGEFGPLEQRHADYLERLS